MSSGPDLDQAKEKILGAMLWFDSLRLCRIMYEYSHHLQCVVNAYRPIPHAEGRSW